MLANGLMNSVLTGENTILFPKTLENKHSINEVVFESYGKKVGMNRFSMSLSIR